MRLFLLLVSSASAWAQLSPRGNNGTGDFPVRPLRQPTAIAWEAKPGFRDFGHLAYSKGIIVTGNVTGTGGVFGFDAASGKILWGTRGKQMQGAPAVDNDSAYVITGQGGVTYRLTCYALTTGKPRWSVEEEDLGIHDGPPIVQDGRVYVISNNGKVKAFDAATGKPIWEQRYSPEKGHCPTAMALAGGILYFGGGHVPFARSQGRFLWALDAATGAIRWKFKAKPEAYNDGGECTTAPAVASGTVVFGSEFALFALDAHTGSLRWRKDLPKKLSEPVIAGGVIYTQTAKALNGFDLATGSRVFELPGKYYDNPGTNRMAAAGGILYFTADTESDVHWPIYALDLKTQQVLWRHRSNRPNKYNSVSQWRTSYLLPIDDALIYENEGLLAKLR